MSDTPREPFTPLDAVEMAHAFVGMGNAIVAFYRGLVVEGMTEEQAMRITLTYVHGLAGGKLS